MRLSALVHLAKAVLEMSEAERIVVFGSASLLATYPELGEQAGSPIEATFDADIVPFPFEEAVGEMLHEAFGDGRRFHQRFGYHADIVRPKITETFPAGWEERSVPLPGVDRAICLNPVDMAAVKSMVARPKDAEQVEWLVHRGLLDLTNIRESLRLIHVGEELLVKGHALLNRLEAGGEVK